MRWREAALVLGLVLLPAAGASAQGVGFTQEDRYRLIRLEATLQVFMEQVDKRFQEVQSRFGQLTSVQRWSRNATRTAKHMATYHG